MVPVSTRKVSIRLTTTYAGFEGESDLLERARAPGRRDNPRQRRGKQRRRDLRQRTVLEHDVSNGVRNHLVHQQRQLLVVLRRRDRFWQWPFLAAGVFFPALAASEATRRPIATLGAYVVVLFALLALELRHGRAHVLGPHRL